MAPWSAGGAGGPPRARSYGNSAVEALPELVQEWYHAVATPLGVGNLPWAKACVAKGVDVNARLDGFGGNAIFVAIEQGNWEMLTWLVEEAGADLHAVDFGGYNALDYAAACRQHLPDRPPRRANGAPAPSDIASYLREQGLQYTWFGAVLAEDVDRIWEFLENGQDVDARGGHFQRNAVEEALDNGSVWIARFLVVKGGTVGVRQPQFEFPKESTCSALIAGRFAN
eukprot:TRINITY_DN28775_c0_g1_i1.p2 TRINITY_DN28775_c0_g1~~TRINITY_DN28775_c0_g1_i1.p2  ORF type:complete len:227 (-),score=53.24 TRINITY_DN28775_c0_g1_i1:147-827(-)